MGHKSEYRSSKRSKALIRSALLSLMKDKSIDKITITEIAQKADINRGTFYAHYKNVSEVLESIQNDVASQLSSIFRNLKLSHMMGDSERILGECISIIRQDPEYYRILLSMDNGRGVLGLWRSSVIDYLESASFLAGQAIANGTAYRCAIAFAVNGTVECIVDSLVGRSGIPLDALPRHLSRLIASVLSPFMSQVSRGSSTF